MDRTKILYHLLALAVVAVWGVTFVCTKVLIAAGLRPAEIFALRFALAYLGIRVLTLAQGAARTTPAAGGSSRSVRRPRARVWSRNWRDELMFVFLGITGGSFYFLTENTALAYTQASNTSFLVCSAPLLTALLILLYRRVRRDRFSEAMEDVRPDFPLVGGTLLAFSGMALMLFDGARVQVSLRGDLLALGAALCWAFYSLFMGKMTEEYGAVFATRKVFFYGLLTILPFLPGREPGTLWEILRQTPVALNLLFLGLAASLACFVAWNLVMARLGNITATNYVYLNPVFTLISAMLLLGERLTWAGAAGSALILGGIILAGRRRSGSG